MATDALTAAIQSGDLSAVQSHLASLPASSRPAAYAAAASLAVQHAQPAILTDCLTTGRVSAAGYRGLDLALAAAKHGTPATVGALLDHGGLDPRDEPHEHLSGTFLNFAAEYDNLPVLKYLLEQRGYGVRDFGPVYKQPAHEPLRGAVARASPATFGYLLNRGADPQRAPGLTCLAASSGNVGVLWLLLHRGVGGGVNEIAAPYHNAGTPLHHAADARQMSTFKALLDAGADVEKRDPKGRDVIERSKYKDHEGREWPELIEELKMRGMLARLGRE